MSLYRYFGPRPFSLLNEMMNDFARMERFTPMLGVQNVADDQLVDSDKKFAVNLNVAHFNPEELKINLDGRQLTIEGAHELKNEHGFTKRSFYRSVTLPEDVELSSISSHLSDDGHLSIEAAKKEIVRGGKPIQIQQAQHTPEIAADQSKENEKQ